MSIVQNAVYSTLLQPPTHFKPVSWYKPHLLCGHLLFSMALIDPGRGTTRAEDAQGTPTHSHISPSILVYEDSVSRHGDQCWQLEDAVHRFAAGQYFTEMCSGSEAGSYLRLVDLMYHSTLGLRVMNKRRRTLRQRLMANTRNPKPETP